MDELQNRVHPRAPTPQGEAESHKIRPAGASLSATPPISQRLARGKPSCRGPLNSQLLGTNLIPVQNGLRYAYNKSTAIYRCPSDLGRSVFGNRRYPRVRSYSMNGYLNGVDVGLVYFNQRGYKVNKKTSDITAPPPARVLVFLDEHENSIDDGHFGFAPEGDQWMNLPASWHSRGCSFSFADGHAEKFVWRDPRTAAIKVINSVSTPNNPDLKRLQAALATKS